MEGISAGAETALRAHLGEVESCCIEARCSGCGSCSVIPLRMLVKKYGPDKAVGAFVSRLSCKRCGVPPRTVTLKENMVDYRGAKPGWSRTLIDRTATGAGLGQAGLPALAQGLAGPGQTGRWFARR